jgi:transposase InsO family protein
LKILFRVSGLSKSTYYYYSSARHKNAVKRKKEDEERILSLITPVFEHHKSRYGYRRILLELKEELRGINHKKIQKIMSRNGLLGKQGKNGKYHSYKGDNGEFKENLLLHKNVDEVKHKTTYVRDFGTTRPNEKWTTDVSEFKGPEGKLYLSPIMDMYDGSIVSYDISFHPDFEQTRRMLDKAFRNHPDLEGLIFHSDQGWQYQMKPYQEMLKERGIRQSFSRKGNCMDNSLMENFFGIMKNEMYYGYTFESMEELKAAMEEYIDYYNNERINIKRKGLSPLAYRQQSLSKS